MHEGPSCSPPSPEKRVGRSVCQLRLHPAIPSRLICIIYLAGSSCSVVFGFDSSSPRPNGLVLPSADDILPSSGKETVQIPTAEQAVVASTETEVYSQGPKQKSLAFSFFHQKHCLREVLSLYLTLCALNFKRLRCPPTLPPGALRLRLICESQATCQENTARPSER